MSCLVLEVELLKSLRPSFQPARVFILPVRWSFWKLPWPSSDVFRPKALVNDVRSLGVVGRDYQTGRLCERLQSRGVKPENSADETCFHFFTFRWSMKIPDTRLAPRGRKNSKKNHLTDKLSSSTNVIVWPLVVQLKV